MNATHESARPEQTPFLLPVLAAPIVSLAALGVWAAFLVEKRFGIGYTFNFAHPFAWGLVALLVVILSVAGFL